MKKIIFLCIITLFLTSCQYIGQKKEQIKIPDIHEGTQGVTLEFLQNAPPKEVYEDRFFEILVQTQNAGATDIKGGMLVLSTGEQQISIEGEPGARYDLEGKSVYNPEGSKEIKEFRAKSKLLMTGIAAQDASITASTCYPYKTEATALVCIDTDIAGQVKTKPCKTTTINMAAGQGAPISITSVEPKMLSHEDPQKIQPEFLIKLKNAGTGQAMLREKVYDACTGKPIGSEAWNRVTIKAALSDMQLTCSPETVQLTADTTIVCILQEGIDKNKGTYTAPLSIEAEYGYLDSTVKEFTIKKMVTK